jgi:hypothetical protein
MPSSGMLRRVALVRAEVSEEPSVSIIEVTRIGELGGARCLRNVGSYKSRTLRSVRWLLVTAKVVPISLILVTLIMEALSSSDTSVLTRATQRNFQEDGIILSIFILANNSEEGQGSQRAVVPVTTTTTMMIFIFIFTKAFHHPFSYVSRIKCRPRLNINIVTCLTEGRRY